MNRWRDFIEAACDEAPFLLGVAVLGAFLLGAIFTIGGCATTAPETCDAYLERVAHTRALAGEVLVDRGIELIPDGVVLWGRWQSVAGGVMRLDVLVDGIVLAGKMQSEETRLVPVQECSRGGRVWQALTSTYKQLPTAPRAANKKDGVGA